MAKTTKFTAANLRSKTAKELQTMLSERKSEMVEKRRSLHAGELANPHSLGDLRREVAVIKTVISQLAASSAKEEKK